MADSEGRTKVAEIKNRSVDSRGQSSHKRETRSDGDGTERAKCMRICPIDLNRSPDWTEDGHASVSDRAAFLIDLNRSPERPTEDGETSSASVLANVSTTRFLLDPNKPPERTEDGETEKEISCMLDDAGHKYDVFLSFYGKDARYKFTSHLYAALTRHGIQTFLDNPELATGDVIDDALAQAINASKIYVVVFSENYAYSPWCLNELLEIYKCYENMKRLIIGVYCGIDPAVVRHQTESFAKAFEKHEEGRYKDRKDLVNQWRTALTNVANLSGKSIPSQRSEAAIIDEIIDVVLLKVNPKTLHVAKYPLGWILLLKL